MYSKSKWTVVGVALTCLAGLSLRADPVTVQELGIGSHETVNITSSTVGTWNVYAGIINLEVNGVANQGFCIDPFHWSLNGPQTYELGPLSSAPKPPGGPMAFSTAIQIEQLWQYAYSPTMGNAAAAGLQIAIWELVSGGPNSTGTFTLNSSLDYGASTLLTWLQNNPNAPTASLAGVTGPGQDYVIKSVPDGGATILLLGFALFSILLLKGQGFRVEPRCSQPAGANPRNL